MPELPEVHTTVEGLNRRVRGKKITDVWSAYNSAFHAGKQNIKNVHYFKDFRQAILGASFLQAKRRGKNILLPLSNGHTILIHMKMTGHLLYGQYSQDSKTGIWRAENTAGQKALQDPYNQYIRLVFNLSDGKHLAFSDLRKFGKVFVFPTAEAEKVPDVSLLGPEPLSPSFTFEQFKEQLLKRPKTPIKSVLMDQQIIAGIGNIYSDEMLWAAGIHPLSAPAAVPEKAPAGKPSLRELFREMRLVLEKGIHFGGDSESDYRNIDGEFGQFQNKHHAYRHTGEKCAKPGCKGIIQRMKIGGRSGHFCPVHQELFKLKKTAAHKPAANKK